MSPTYRPVAILALATLLAVGLAACGAPREPIRPLDAPEENVLNVYNWSDYIDPSVIPAFEQETGITVHYDVFDSNEVLFTKLLAGHTGYDVVVPSASFLEKQLKAGAFRPLDTSLLPGLANLDPALTARVARHDAGNRHAVNYLWGTSGVGYDVDRIRARLPDAPVDSWRMFYDPAVVSRFKDCGVAMIDAPSEVLGTVLIYLGRDPNSEKPEDLADARQALAAIRPYIRYVNSSKYIEDLANGEICLALGWVGDVFQARDRANEAQKGRHIEYRIPREGAIIFFDMLAIPADAPHPRNAHRFIDYLLRPEVAAKNASKVRYANSNAASWSLIAPAVRQDPAIFPPPEVMAKLQPDLAESPEFTRLLTRAWTRFKTGR